MEPPNIPTTNLCKAKLMRAELLIQTHKKQLVQHVKPLCNIDLNIHVSITEVLSFHVHIHLWHITKQEQSNTVKCLDPENEIMEHLEDHVYDEIMELNTHILDTLLEEKIVCFLKHDTIGSFKGQKA